LVKAVLGWVESFEEYLKQFDDDALTGDDQFETAAAREVKVIRSTVALDDSEDPVEDVVERAAGD